MLRFLGFALILITSVVFASSETLAQKRLYRTFWHPKLSGERLNFCDEAKTNCGKYIADGYCQVLGFNHARRFELAYHLGLTHFLSGKNACRGWQCSGFDWIECAGARNYKIRPASDYSQALFVKPRWKKLPLDYCYDNKSGCGKREAYAYCRWQGYLHVVSFKKATNVHATRQMGRGQQCYGKHCEGYEYIICEH